LQGLKKSKINTNLLPGDIVVERIIRAKKPWVLAAVSALALGLVLGYVFTTNAWWRVNDEYTDANNVNWKSAISKVKTKESNSSRFVENDTQMKAQLDKFNKIATELASATEKKAIWIEFYSALAQAFHEDPRIAEAKKAGNFRIDPADIPFDDREEVYVDHVESKYFEDLQVWLNDVQAIYNKMFQITKNGEIIPLETPVAPTEDELAAAEESEDESVDSTGGWGGGGAEGDDDFGDEEETVALSGALGGKSGWVIEIKGHHFHNSDKALAELNAGKSFLTRTLIEPLINKEDVFVPTNDPDQMFSYSDLGISFPTITNSIARAKRTIVFDPTAVSGQDEDAGMDGMGGGRGGGGKFGGMGGGMGGMGAGGPGDDLGGMGGMGGDDPDVDDKNSHKVWEYKFVVQMAWTPRSEKERLAARAERRKAEADAEAAAAAAPVDGEDGSLEEE
jgi:type IV pilus assembly protein PilM